MIEAMRPSALVLPVALLLACSGEKSGEPGAGGSARSGGDDAPAGVVVEVSGTVTARLAGTKDYRTLAVDSPVYAKDTITTAKDASISIRLHHNDAVLSLAGNKSRQLEQTAAWRAPRGASAGMFEGSGESSTAAAGRHAEREAAGTRATAPGGGDTPATTPPPTEPETVPRLMPPRPEPKPAAAPPPPPAPEPRERQVMKKKSKAKKKPVGPVNVEKIDEPSETKLPDRLSRAQVIAGIAGIKDKARACATAHPAHGVVNVTFTIAPSGAVSSARVKSAPDEALGACVVAAVKTARFDKSKNGMTVTFPFSL